jgi:hypothetical protein
MKSWGFPVGVVLAIPVGVVLVAVVMVVGALHFLVSLLHAGACLVRVHATQPALDWFEALPGRVQAWGARLEQEGHCSGCGQDFKSRREWRAHVGQCPGRPG